VFTEDLISTWISYKRKRELATVNLRPVPSEFFLYFDL
jgi:glutamine synthetase